jgi:hypothetical protein
MAAIVQNNAYGVLAANIASGATSLTLQTGNGARFPVASGGFFGAGSFWVTLVDASNNIEIVKCTTHVANSDTFTIQRAQQSTTARAFVAGDRFEMRITKEHFNEKLNQNNGYIGITGGSSAIDGASGTDIANMNNITKRGSLVIDTTAPINLAPYAMSFKATDGYWYILYCQAANDGAMGPFYGPHNTTANPNSTTHLIRVPQRVDGIDIPSYDEVILTSDVAEHTAIAWSSSGYIVGTGHAGAGHFGVGNATDQVRWILSYNGQDSSKAWYNHWPRQVLTNNRGLANVDTSQTVWIRTDYNTIWAAGEGAGGALGNNALTDVTTWYNSLQTGLTAIDSVEQMWCAPNTINPVAIARKYDGTWWAVGHGASGVCGNAVVTNRTVWTQITGLPTTSVTKAAFAGTGVIIDFVILFSDGTFWGAGDNNAGSLGDGTVVLKNTYAQRAADVSDFWIGPDNFATGNNTTWLLKTNGELHTAGSSGFYQALSGATANKLTFTLATDTPVAAGFTTLERVWVGSGESVGFFYQRWFNPSTGEYRIYSVGSAVDGVRGHGVFAAATVNSNITTLLPVPAADVAWMGSCHTLTASRKGYGILITNSGDMYATGRVLGASDNATYDTYNPFPHRFTPNGSSLFNKVNLEDYSAW